MRNNLLPPTRSLPGTRLLTVALATDQERELIYRARHEVYARELGQHHVNTAGRLRDPLDDRNVYLVARSAEALLGFISVTPPGAGSYSIDKYFARATLPFAVNDRLHEVRLLTVLKPHRGREVATLLMYAAFRWVEAHGGERVVAIGRHQILDLYLKAGLLRSGLSVRAGEVGYELLHATTDKVRAGLESLAGLLMRLEEKTDWQLNFPFRQPASCFHGGAFFYAIGERFETLERRHEVINADVLDAWFPPSPRVLKSLREHLPWILQTSPPTGAEGLIAAVARARGVATDNILPGAGSSDLIFRALRHWLTPRSHALILDPTYGEYAHVLERVIGCTLDRLLLDRDNHYAVDLSRLEAALADGYDFVALVNPNSPTGRHVSRAELARVLRLAPPQTRIWVDETYVEYAGADQSLEGFAAQSENVIVCKSMSKMYALSGARVAYLCAGVHQLEALRAITPPWVVSLPAQIAAVEALADPEYYAARYRETARLREQLVQGLRSLGWEIEPGTANFLLCHLPVAGPDASTLVARCRRHGLFLRDASAMGSRLGTHALRIAVKDAETNRQMLEILQRVGLDATRDSLSPQRGEGRGRGEGCGGS